MAKAKIPVEVRVIYNKSSYRCEIREAGAMFGATSGDFLPTDRDVAQIDKLTEIVSGELKHLAALDSKSIADYVVNVSIQAVRNVNNPKYRSEVGIQGAR